MPQQLEVLLVTFIAEGLYPQMAASLSSAGFAASSQEQAK